MNKQEFLVKCCEEINTSDKSQLKALVEVFKMYIPSNAEIGDDKTVMGFYEYLRKELSSRGIYFVSDPEVLFNDVYKYLNIKEDITETKKFSLEDIFS